MMSVLKESKVGKDRFMALLMVAPPKWPTPSWTIEAPVIDANKADEVGDEEEPAHQSVWMSV